jgi:hypothetical protein
MLANDGIRGTNKELGERDERRFTNDGEAGVF